jgi:phosphoribosylformimino-5-aminoimidazole carboxamide ribotide isomerase
VSAERIVFSLDLKGGVPLGSLEWGSDPDRIASLAIECGVRRLIVLDLAGVGAEAGVPTIPLCQRLRTAHGPEIEIITGGGVRHAADLLALEQACVDGVLVASVLHRPECWLAAP